MFFQNYMQNNLNISNTQPFYNNINDIKGMNGNISNINNINSNINNNVQSNDIFKMKQQLTLINQINHLFSNSNDGYLNHPIANK